jgi:hypothetical protein
LILMAAKQRADLQKEKEKKEKIILAVLVGLLVIVGAFELPKMLKKGGSPTPAAAQTTSTSPSATSPSATSPGATPVGTAASGPVAVGSLPNSSTYQAADGQLSQFSLFNGRDPFGSSNPPIGATTTPGQSTNTTTTSAKPPKVYSAANITVNGASQVVLPKATFPVSSPAFVLLSMKAKQITIGVNGGSFASGQAKVIIAKGRSVVLVNTVDSIRYVIKYVGPLTLEQAAALMSTTSTTGTTTGGTTTGTTTSATTSATTSTTP